MSGKIELNLAMSLDGYIVDDEGKYDWITGDNDPTLDTKKMDDLGDLSEQYDYIVLGRTSYNEFGHQDMFKGKKLIVATHEKLTNTNGVTFVSKELLPYVCSLRDKGHQIWLFGGSILTDFFIKENKVDIYKVAIIPIIVGNGKRLFFDNNPRIHLHLDSYDCIEGMMMFQYSKRSKK
jgi:dihydrofolate reductase